LADSRLADEVRKSLYYFAESRYDLLAYVVMPSHFHWVFHPRREWYEAVCGVGFQPAASADRLEAYPTKRRRMPREIIMHSIRRYTANVCNSLLGRSGAFWQTESYDHVVRNDEELWRIIDYVERNPCTASLVSDRSEWRWSSARDRSRRGVHPGEPLLRSDVG